jgi:hypothetical protein
MQVRRLGGSETLIKHSGAVLQPDLRVGELAIAVPLLVGNETNKSDIVDILA